MSKKSDKFFKYLKTDTPVVPAALLNEAGIIGVALAAADLLTDLETPLMIDSFFADQLLEGDSGGESDKDERADQPA